MATQTLSPPLDHRQRSDPPELIVLHATAGATARSSIQHLRSVGLSYHAIIARDGRDSAKSENADGSAALVFACVPVDAAAFHVGSTIPAPSGRRINTASIGIALANIQRKASPEPYTQAQLAALDALIAALRADLPSLAWLTTHATVQPWNRSDPLGMDGRALAARHGLQFFAPSAATIAAHTPPRP